MQKKRFDQRIYKVIERKNHQQHLVSILPIITIFFGIQCFFLRSFLPEEVSIGNYALILAGTLSLMIYAVNIYDTKFLNVIYQDHLWLFFSPLRVNQRIYFKEIESISIPDESESFGAITFHLRNGKKRTLYFVDEASDIKKMIENLQREQRKVKTAA